MVTRKNILVEFRKNKKQSQIDYDWADKAVNYLIFKTKLITKGRFQKKKKYGIFHTLVGWVGLKKSFSIKNKNKKHGLKMPKIA